MRKLFATALLLLMLVVCVAPVMAIDLPIPDCSPENCSNDPIQWCTPSIEIITVCAPGGWPCFPLVIIRCE